MDELTLLRRTRDDSREPSREALQGGRTALMNRISGDRTTTSGARRRSNRRWVPRVGWTAGIAAAALTGVLVAGNISLSAQSAYASDVLRTAAADTIQYADLVPGSGQYLRSHTHARWGICDQSGCVPNDQILDVYMPADPAAEWVLYRDWGTGSGVFTDESIETTRAAGGFFYGPDSSWVNIDYADIPLDGEAAYEWVDGRYVGGSASRSEDNFVRIADILRSGLVPGPQRAALLDALSRVPGVTATEDVANLDGVKGVAIGRNEILRAGERQEIIIDPVTGLVIGERMTSGARLFGWGPDSFGWGPDNNELGSTAIETTIVDEAL